jgi:hypothetical protein
MEMLAHNSENKRRIGLLNEQLEINERNMRDLQVTIKSLEEKLQTQQQTVQYVQNKAENIELTFNNHQLGAKLLLKNITILFAIMRESRILPVSDDFLAVFNKQTAKLDNLAKASPKEIKC